MDCTLSQLAAWALATAREERRRDRGLLLLLRAAQATEKGFSRIWDELSEESDHG